ncbi:MAG: gephyrin-like molybdotransferase Glp [Clostridiaceae bacterium]
MISISDALKIICKEGSPRQKEKRELLDCLNLVLAEDIYSRNNLPPFDKSAMDGYAVRSEDTLNANIDVPKEFIVKGVIKAGEWCSEALNSGEAFKIMTGAPVPSGADSVIEVEKVKAYSDKILLNNEVKKNNNIIKLGEEIKVGDIALSKGTEIRPSEIGLLASLGYSFVEVYKPPTIGLIITGDELVNIDSSIEKGKIRNSNEYSITAMIKALGAEVLSFGIVQDDKEVLKEVVIDALEKTDIVITSGGASVGDYDFVETILEEIRANIKFNSVSIKPGKPLTFATYKDKYFFSLPGNPLAAITTFEEFIEPLCNKIMGKKEFLKEEFPVIITEDIKVKKGRVKYQYVNIVKKNNIYYANRLGSQSSNRLTTISKSNGIIKIPEDITLVKAGDILSGRFIFKK